MSIRNLEYLLRPRSIALVGASEAPDSVGRVTAENLLNGGLDGDIFFVNPNRESVLGRPCWPDVESLPEAPDLAVIATPPATIPGIVEALCEKGTRAGIIITAGIDARTKQAILDTARRYVFRVLGPNCLGLMAPKAGVNAGFAHLAPKAGNVAFVSQSGALLTATLDWATPREIGFSHLVSVGDMADVDFGDMIDILALDGSVKAILLYIESITDVRKFMSAARAAARLKPVVTVKAGRSEAAASAAQSHTGALAGMDAVYDAAFARAGVLRVETLEDLFETVETLSKPLKITGETLTILTNGGGLGVLATDALMDADGALTELSDATIAALDDVLPPTWSRANPVDIIGDAPAERYEQSLEILLEAPETDAVLVMNCPTAVASPIAAAEAAVRVAKRKPGKILTCWAGAETADAARRLFAGETIPTFDTPDRAIDGLMTVIRHRRNQEALMETPLALPDDTEPDAAAARRIVAENLSDDGGWMPTAKVKALLEIYGIPVVPTRIAADPAEAGRFAGEIGGPVALKIVSPDITHKVDVGGVALNVDPATAESQAKAMQARVRKKQPDAQIDGVSVEPMVATRDAHELILGIFEDPQFGPVILFGQGGSAVEVVADTAFGLPPLNPALARNMMRRTRIWRLLQGYRNVPPADIDAIATLLVRLGQLAADLPEVVELDINPLIVRGDALTAVDMRVRLEPKPAAAAERLAIRPYPREWETEITLKDGADYWMRPITPADEPPLHDMIAQMSPESLQMRFFAPIKKLPHQVAARLTQIDYDREMAFVLTERGAAGRCPIYAVARLDLDPDKDKGEFAVLVRDDCAGRGMGTAVMEHLIRYAETQGTARIWGDVRRDNAPMLALCDRLGLASERNPDDPSLVQRTLVLGAETA